MTTRTELAAILKTTEKNLDARIVGLHIGPVCSRCGGCGRYSFNQVHGDLCYGCNGKGNILPKAGYQFEETVARARTVAADGTLDAYIERLTAAARCKGGMKRAFAAWNKMDALNGYNANWRNAPADVAARNQVGCDLIHALQKLEQVKKGQKIDWVEYDRVLTAGLARLAEITAELQK